MTVKRQAVKPAKVSSVQRTMHIHACIRTHTLELHVQATCRVRTPSLLSSFHTHPATNPTTSTAITTTASASTATTATTGATPRPHPHRRQRVAPRNTRRPPLPPPPLRLQPRSTSPGRSSSSGCSPGASGTIKRGLGRAVNKRTEREGGGRERVTQTKAHSDCSATLFFLDMVCLLFCFEFSSVVSLRELQ